MLDNHLKKIMIKKKGYAYIFIYLLILYDNGNNCSRMLIIDGKWSHGYYDGAYLSNHIISY